MAEAKIALYALTAGLVLDRSVFIAQTADEIKANINTIRARSRSTPLTVINSADVFFTSNNMLALIKAGDDSYKLIAEKTGVTVRDEDVDAIRRVEAIVQAMKPPLPPYAFAKVPEGWSIETDLIVGTAAVRRKRINPNGDGSGYQISFTQLKRIWAITSKRWAKLNSIDAVSDISAGGYRRHGHIEDTLITIGCQTVRRYELEQLALHQNWPFPEAPKVAA